MSFTSVTLEDKPLFAKHFSPVDFSNSERCFSTIYLWRNSYDYKKAVVDGCLCILGARIQTGELFLHYPHGQEPIKALRTLSSWADRLGFPLRLGPITAAQKAHIEARAPTLFDYESDRDAFDYVYSVGDLIALEGKKYHAKRNFVTRFERENPYEYVPVTQANAKKYAAFVYDHVADDEERSAMEDMFDNLDYLGITAGAIEVRGEVVAVSAGEALTDHTVLIHLEKAKKELAGAYPTINREFLARAWPHMTYVNREEDLGIEGLRKAKLSYHPSLMVEKFNAISKGASPVACW